MSHSVFDFGSSSRRDDRHAPPAGQSRVAFDHPVDGRRCVAELTLIGTAGLGFLLPSPTAEIGPGTVLCGTSIEIGDFALRGDVVVRKSSLDTDGTTLGGLFYPAEHESERALTQILADLGGAIPRRGLVTSHLRCGECHGPVQVVLDSDRDGPVAVPCANCGRQYRLKRPTGWSETTERLFSRARRLALDNEIDLPSAYSVLYGVMNLVQARALQRASSAGLANRQPENQGALTVRYDPGFREAVEAGLLTARQAFERGKRDAAAARVAREHQLSQKSALAVVDNRISLLAAIRNRDSVGESGSAQATLRTSRSRAAGSTKFVIALVGIVAVALFFLAVGDSKEGQLNRGGGEAAIHTDSTGQIVRIEGPDPSSVLEAYCASNAGRQELESLGTIESGSDGPGLTLGILRDPSASDELLAIYISMDRSTRRWTAGNGRSPLVAFQAPGGISSAPR